MDSERNSDLEVILEKARRELPFGDARKYGFESRLKESLKEVRKSGDFEGFGNVCWKLGWAGFSAMALTIGVSIFWVDSTTITGVMASCADYLNPQIFSF